LGWLVVIGVGGPGRLSPLAQTKPAGATAERQEAGQGRAA